MPRRRGGDVYTEKKEERQQELGELSQSGVAKQMIEKYKKEGALLHGGRRRKTRRRSMRGKGIFDYFRGTPTPEKQPVRFAPGERERGVQMGLVTHPFILPRENGYFEPDVAKDFYQIVLKKKFLNPFIDVTNPQHVEILTKTLNDNYDKAESDEMVQLLIDAFPKPTALAPPSSYTGVKSRRGSIGGRRRSTRRS